MSSSVAHSSDINLDFSGDVQALVDHISGKTTLSSSASVTAAADFNESGSVDLADASSLANAIVSQSGSNLILYGSNDLSTINISPAAALNLNAILLGDVNGSYANALA